MFKNRSTIDVVVIMMTLIIGMVLLLTLLGIIVGKLSHPGMDVSRGAEALTNVTTTIVGALVGFIGGRATGRWEGANGKELTNGKTN